MEVRTHFYFGSWKLQVDVISPSQLPSNSLEAGPLQRFQVDAWFKSKGLSCVANHMESPSDPFKMVGQTTKNNRVMDPIFKGSWRLPGIHVAKSQEMCQYLLSKLPGVARSMFVSCE